ncbi:aminodeoxychorismate synthase component I [Pseudoalteromonas sp. SCSIO 43201]|uniref:aminodeoxychorismate synthase n=1 Tax=Pseudoalteromonas peptidolytica F12-50-A1 TaxID=1315280 RepID=A0A8I0MVC7_9GAMM|nr:MULTISPECIES: aminodeoxychorismate synthase component I [Pseudoalteromonas]MBE0346047.1 para-aminobenzoate synthetase component I [Pseudoalteromonas peptidolytica F12-50-A1]MDW7548113.1 aminodeoxychorismate synthase component I [Pseudoalteromonas peptidolytica]NLR14708.1 aminodeoxychorismate synthase component I [Pseudoalteromonas peptidolytica]USD27301.1 aminodeoxychorismate synthase component I [Pseudoalteromonas sp. SCSIO 43201]GEK09895.1 aminodeoxychorismate synthase, component I [Pseud
MINEQINCVKLDIQLSAVELFEYFANETQAILLDSCDSEHINSRYHIIAFEPLHTLEARDGAIYLDGKIMDQSAFTIMKSKLALMNQSQASHGLPFTGGWLGYFGYDFGRYIEQIPSTADQDISLPDTHIGLYPDALIFDKTANAWFYVSQPKTDRLANYLSRIEAPSCYNAFTLTSTWRSNMSQTQYEDKFNKIQAYLLSGDCYQINLAQRFSATYDGAPWLAYKKLRNSNRAPFSAFYTLGNSAVLSVSPERFIQVKNNVVETKPIKGTLPRLPDEQADLVQAKALRNSTKDRAENVMIVDLLRNDLGKVAKPGSVTVPALFDIESFPAVHHLVSTITSELAEGKCAVDQLEAAFPGGSITGAPKIRAMEIIEELEPHRRSVYCGSIGYLSACGNMDTSITIRTLVCHQNKIYCWAGGGIVKDSQAQLEYEETYHKVNKILPVLNEN